MLEELIEYVAKSLVDNPDAVHVDVSESGRSTTYYLTVDPKDMGKVIGRQGKIARAFRTLVSIAATREGVRANLEIREA
ncbi:MAG: KH domain-containing protein [Chloroflexota bacterium]|nr:KH domain-containing protein [Chloroflexota bacterium]